MTAITPSKRPTTKQLSEIMKFDIPNTNLSTTVNKKYTLSYINGTKPLIFGLDNVLSQLGYNICEHMVDLHSQVNKNNLHTLIFAIIHLLYYPTMDLHADIYTQGFIELTDKPYSNVLMESHENLSNYLFKFIRL